MNNDIVAQIEESIQIKQLIARDEVLLQKIHLLSISIINSYNENGKVLLAGNGGSAADAQHIAGELVSRFNFDRPALPAMALTTDTSIITAIGNDYGFDKVFSRQISASGTRGDIFIGISTSGKSKNILEAITLSKSKGLITVLLTGRDVAVDKSLCDFILEVPSSNTPRIQESHIMIGHIICQLVEEGLFGKDK